MQKHAHTIFQLGVYRKSRKSEYLKPEGIDLTEGLVYIHKRKGCLIDLDEPPKEGDYVVMEASVVRTAALEEGIQEHPEIPRRVANRSSCAGSGRSV